MLPDPRNSPPSDDLECEYASIFVPFGPGVSNETNARQRALHFAKFGCQMGEPTVSITQPLEAHGEFVGWRFRIYNSEVLPIAPEM
jgi:hypothetical protein